MLELLHEDVPLIVLRIEIFLFELLQHIIFTILCSSRGKGNTCRM